MLQFCCIGLMSILSGFACSKAFMDGGPSLSKNTIDHHAASATDTPEVASERPDTSTSVPMSVEPISAEEKINPPANISGAYLICTEVLAPTEASSESVVNCALRDETSNNKINLTTAYSRATWSYHLASIGKLEVLMAEMNASLEWHVAIHLKAPSLAEVLSKRDEVRFFLTVEDNQGIKYQNSAPPGPMFIEWMPLDGAKVPAAAVIGGTQDDQKKDLFICRLYAGGEVIPGKMIIHYNDSNKSACFTTMNNNSLRSQSNDAKTLIYKSDVLRITAGGFDDYFEWVPSANGARPAQAVAVGIDGNGNPLYSCRNLQVDGSIPEQTPGVLRPGAEGCVHQFYGVNLHKEYQVLAWKLSGTQKILSSSAP